jgi:hypothetical protein
MKITREDNTFIRQNARCGDKSIKTKYQFKDLDGTMYNIYISTRKNAFIKKVSESGKEYKIKLPKEVTAIILEELKSEKDKLIKREGGIK